MARRVPHRVESKEDGIRRALAHHQTRDVVKSWKEAPQPTTKAWYIELDNGMGGEWYTTKEAYILCEALAAGHRREAREIRKALEYVSVWLAEGETPTELTTGQYEAHAFIIDKVRSGDWEG